MAKQWQILPPITADFEVRFPEVNKIVLQLLANRGLTTEPAVTSFLKPDYNTGVYDPFLFRHMEKAVERVWRAINNKEKVVVHGDYDADGVCSSAILLLTLKKMGLEADLYIPFREKEGYGLNPQSAAQFIVKEYKLVITTDSAITNVTEVQTLQDAGVDVIITDHHQSPPVLPSAFAILNPMVPEDTYPWRRLSGTGVAYKLAQGLVQRAAQYNPAVAATIPAGWEKWLLDLVAIATIADMMELIDENRVLVSYGLTVLRKSRNIGLQAMADLVGTPLAKMSSRSIAFQISPRINAAGRMNHATIASKLILCDQPTEAMGAATELHEINNQRQTQTEQIVREALRQVGEVNDQQNILIAHGTWNTGILGLVAGRLCNQFYRPTLVIGQNQEGDMVGSARSIEQFNITTALTACSDYLVKFGGHAQAAGFTVKPEKLFEFKEKMTQLANEALVGVVLTPTLKLEAVVDLDHINWDLYDQIQQFEPFGIGNLEPVFMVEGVTVIGVETMGSTQKHLRLLVRHRSSTVRKFVGFGCGELANLVKVGSVVDIAFTASVNEWNGNRELQLIITDVRYE